jgi:hypothetical protein
VTVPLTNLIGEVAVSLADLRPAEAALEDEVETIERERDSHRGCLFSNMLCGECVHTGLVPSTQERRVKRTVRHDLAVDLPALCRGSIATHGRSLVIAREFDLAAWTDNHSCSVAVNDP